MYAVEPLPMDASTHKTLIIVEWMNYPPNLCYLGMSCPCAAYLH